MRRLLLIAMLTGTAGALPGIFLFSIPVSILNLITNLFQQAFMMLFVPLSALTYIGIMIAKGISERSRELIYLGVIFGCLSSVVVHPFFNSMRSYTLEGTTNDIPIEESRKEDAPTYTPPTTIESITNEVPIDEPTPTHPTRHITDIIRSFIGLFFVGFFAALIKREADFKGSSIKVVALAGTFAALLLFGVTEVITGITLYSMPELAYSTSPPIIIILATSISSAALGSAGIWLGVESTYRLVLGKPYAAPPEWED